MSEANTQVVGSVAEAPAADNLPVSIPPANHGRTGAGWTLFVGVAIGALVAGVGFVLLQVPVIIAGAAVAVLGLVASAILRAAGFGQVERVRTQQ